MAYPAHTDVIGAIQGDAVPRQGAIGGDELVNIRAACGAGWSSRSRCGGWKIGGRFRARDAHDCAHDYQCKD
jgi:hypothetical protein